MKQITSYCRGYKTAADRKRAITMLTGMPYSHPGFADDGKPINYFTCYRDVQSEFALMYGHAEWVEDGKTHVAW